MKFINKKYKNKVIILDNASSHRNKEVKELIQKYNKLLYSVPYQHFTNAIENFFSVLKSKLRKTKSIGYKKLVSNIIKILKEINKDIYKEIFLGSYSRERKYVSKKTNRLRPLKNYL